MSTSEPNMALNSLSRVKFEVVREMAYLVHTTHAISLPERYAEHNASEASHFTDTGNMNADVSLLALFFEAATIKGKYRSSLYPYCDLEMTRIYYIQM